MPAFSASAPNTLYQFSPYGSLKPTKPTVFTLLATMCLMSAAAMRSSFCVVLNTQRFRSSIGRTTAVVPTGASTGTFASAANGITPIAFGEPDGPISASIFCSAISFLTFVTLWVGSLASSR